MPAPFDSTSGLILIPTQFPKGREQEDLAKGVVDFRIDATKLTALKETLGITDFNIGETRVILERLYEGLKIRDKPDPERKINIIYGKNNGLVREPATVLKEGKPEVDCDEATRAGYLLAWESGVKNIVMVEMHWTDPETKERTGHSFIVLMPQEKDGMPRIYDFTYYKKGKPLTVENNDMNSLETAIRKEYAADAVNPDFRIITRNNLNEVEAAHYELVGKYYTKPRTQNWKKSEEAYGRAVSLVPTEFAYNWELGVAYENRGKLKEALDIYKKCAGYEEGKNNPRVLGALGSVYAKLGLNEEATNFLKSALDNNPDTELKLEILRNLYLIGVK